MSEKSRVLKSFSVNNSNKNENENERRNKKREYGFMIGAMFILVLE